MPLQGPEVGVGEQGALNAVRDARGRATEALPWPPRGRTSAAGRTAAALALATCFTAGCSGIKPGRRPEATFESIKRAILDEKYEALWGLLSARSRELKIDEMRNIQRDIEVKLNNMTAADKEVFLRRNGVSPETFVNMAPAELFAMEMRRASRLAAGLEEALAAAEVTGVRTEGDVATLEITVGRGGSRGEREKEKASLTFEREHGLYRVKSFNDLLAAFRPAERTRRPGATPKETYDAFRACMRDRAYEDLWELFSPFMREKLAKAMENLKRELEGLSAAERRSRGRQLGVTLEEFAKMPPEEAFAAKMRLTIEVQRRLPPTLLGEFVSAKTEGDKATAVLKGRRGEYRVPMVLVDGVWLLESF